jgi:hypothetical protein
MNIDLPDIDPQVAPSKGVHSCCICRVQENLKYSHSGIWITPNGRSRRTVLP